MITEPHKSSAKIVQKERPQRGAYSRRRLNFLFLDIVVRNRKEIEGKNKSDFEHAEKKEETMNI